MTGNFIIGRVKEITKPVEMIGRSSGKKFLFSRLTVEVCEIDEKGRSVEVDEENTPQFCFFGSSCRDLEPFRKGDAVKVFFELRGRELPVGPDGSKRVATDVRPVKIFGYRNGRWKG